MKHLARTLLLLLLPATLAAQNPTLVLLTGSEGGTYHAFGLAISRVLDSVRIIPKPSRGSIDNLRKLSAGKEHFAIVQSDIAYAAARGKEPFSKETSIGNVSALMGLFYEDVLLIARKGLDLETAWDIHPDLTVVVGLPASGTNANAQDVLRSINFMGGTFPWEPRASLTHLADGLVDVVFLTAALDDALVATIDSSGGELISLSPEVIATMLGKKPYYEPTTILVDTSRINTVRTRAYLVAENDVPGDHVTAIVSSIYRNWNQLRVMLPGGQQVTRDSLAEAHAIPLHDRAERFYCEQGIRTCNKALRALVLVVSLIAFLTFVVWFSAPTRGWLLRHAPRLSRALFGPHGVTDRYRFVVIPIMVSAFMLTASLVIQWAENRYAQEKNRHSDFEDLGVNRNLIWMLVFSATGFEDKRFPNSATGKITSALMGWVGIGSILVLIGLLTSDKVARRMKMRLQSHPDRLKDHVIVCGWNRRAKTIIGELTTTELGSRRLQVAVVCSRPPEFIDQQNLDEDVVLHIEGEPTDLAKLEQAGVDRAHTVLILADDEASDSDAKGLLTLLTIEKRAHRLRLEGRRLHQLRTVVEILDPLKQQLFRDAHAGAVMCPADFDARLLSNSILNPAVSKFLHGVLTTGVGNEIIEVPVTGRERLDIVGQTFDEILMTCRTDGLLLLAINQGGAPGALSVESRNATLTATGTLLMRQELLTNPASGTAREYRVSSGDSLLFLADSERSLEHIFGDPRHWRVKFTG